MEFDLMCLFQEKIDEVGKGFNHFPKEWELPFNYEEEFPNFAGHALEETDLKKISSEYEIDKTNHTGFVRIYSKIDNNFKKFYSYLEKGYLKYSQSEFSSSNINVKKTSFYDGPFEVMRNYFSLLGRGELSKSLLGIVKRIGKFELNENFYTKVIQHNSKLLDVTFFVKDVPKINFSINENDKKSKQFFYLVRDSPLVFYDKEGIRDFFGEMIIKNSEKEKIKIETFLKQNGI